MAWTCVVLGTAQDGGNPQLGSPGVGPPRMVASLAALADDGTTLLIDVTPDVKAQLSGLASLPSHQRRDSPNIVDHIVLTHAHMGHYAGLVQFGKEAHNARGIKCWVTPSMAQFLRSNQPWRALEDGGHIEIQVTEPGKSFAPAPGLDLRLVQVPHRPDFTDAVGVSLNEVLYLPDIDGWEQWGEAEQVLARHRICLLDATFYDPAELPGRDISHISHPFVDDTVTRFSHLAADRRMILTHLNHSNPISDPESAEAESVRRAGFEVAADLMAFPLAKH